MPSSILKNNGSKAGQRDVVVKFYEFEECNSKFNIAPIMERLTNVLNLRYGCGLRFRPLTHIADTEKTDLCSKLPNSGIHRRENRIFLPITLNKDFIGILDIKDSPLMTTEILNSIRDVISLMIEAVFSAANKIEELSIIEKQLATKSPTVRNSNVISLLNYRAHIHSNLSVVQSKQKTKNFTGSDSIKVPCLLECKSIDDILRMAIEIHEQSDSFAFLSFHQLETEVRGCSKNIASLGNITLFIPNIIKLMDTEIFALIHFLKLKRQPGSPHIIAGSTIPIRTLQNQQLLPSELLQQLNGSFFKIDGSFRDYKNEGIVQHFLENLKKSWTPPQTDSIK